MVSVDKIKKILCFLMGFFSVANAFYFRLGNLNLRLFDIMFILLPVLGLLMINYTKDEKYNKKIIYGLSIVLILFIWLTLTGLYNYHNYIQIYKDFFIRYYINKVLWIIAYAFIYLLYGEKAIYYFLLGLTVMLCFNSLLLLYEYKSALNGYIPEYSFLNNIFINIQEKKFDVVNQGFLRPTGVTMDPNYSGGYSGIAFIFLEYLKRKDFKKYILSFFQFMIILDMILLFSRTGLFSIILCFSYSIFIKVFYQKTIFSKILFPKLFVFSIFMIILFVIYLKTADDLMYNSIIGRLTLQDSSTSARGSYIGSYFDSSNIMKLLFGSGTSNAGFSLSSSFNSVDTEVWSPESNFIAFFVEQGLVFVFLFFILLYYVICRLVKVNFFYSMIFLYINLIGISYNFLGDRIYYYLLIVFILFVFDKRKFNMT